jgi:hypothetical protein
MERHALKNEVLIRVYICGILSQLFSCNWCLMLAVLLWEITHLDVSSKLAKLSKEGEWDRRG